MSRTLRFKVLIYFLVISFTGILLTSFSVFFGFEGHFSNYLQENRDKNITLIKNAIIEEYERTGILVSVEVIGFMHQQAMSEQLFYRIYDSNGNIIQDTFEMQRMMGMMGRKNSSFNNEYNSINNEIYSNDTVISTIQVFYPENLLEEDFIFLISIKRNVIIAAVVTFILSVVFSFLFSNKLVSGFNKFSKAVQQLKQHHFHVRLPVEEFSDEMQSLGQSLNQLAESLSKEEMLRKRFTADFAHEIRTPLATLQSQIEAYQDGIWQPTQERLQQSHNELMRLVRLVNELEKLIVAENPQIKLNITPINVNEILNVIDYQFRPLFMEKGVKLNITESDKPIILIADKDRLIQILTNIINNALKYTNKGNSVAIYLEEKGKYIGIVVKDDGSGISKKDLPYVFERFYRGV